MLGRATFRHLVVCGPFHRNGRHTARPAAHQLRAGCRACPNPWRCLGSPRSADAGACECLADSCLRAESRRERRLSARCPPRGNRITSERSLGSAPPDLASLPQDRCRRRPRADQGDRPARLDFIAHSPSVRSPSAIGGTAGVGCDCGRLSMSRPRLLRADSSPTGPARHAAGGSAGALHGRERSRRGCSFVTRTGAARPSADLAAGVAGWTTAAHGSRGSSAARGSSCPALRGCERG
jgi:hypothetical protein